MLTVIYPANIGFVHAALAQGVGLRSKVNVINDRFAVQFDAQAMQHQRRIPAQRQEHYQLLIRWIQEFLFEL